MKKTLCTKCNNYFSNKGGNYKKHYSSCNGSYRNPKDIGLCIHCNIKFDISDKPSGWMANHSRWCDCNPKRKEYAAAASKNSSQMMTTDARDKAIVGIKKAWVDGKYDHVDHRTFLDRNHTDATIELLRQKALNSKHRRLVRSIRSYLRKDGSTVMLDSSWEEILAKRLDDLDVEWIRPESPIEYVGLDNRKHNYFPDFYLPKYDLYLDPKNPMALRNQKEKVTILKSMMPNLIIIESPEECRSYNPTK